MLRMMMRINCFDPDGLTAPLMRQVLPVAASHSPVFPIFAEWHA